MKLRMLEAATMESVETIFFGDDLYSVRQKPMAMHAKSNAQISKVLASPNDRDFFPVGPKDEIRLTGKK